MAPDSRIFRVHLGGSKTGLKRKMLLTTVPFLALLAITITNVEARTEPAREALEGYELTAMNPATLSEENPSMVASLPPTYLITNSPDGRRSTRNQIHIPTQPAVEKYVRFYTEGGRTTFQESMDRSKPFVSVMCDILHANKVPIELLSIVFVESCFKRQASYQGAVGYWQMLAATARSMGLRVDRWVDERKDPVKSTQAAAKYLRLLYEQFESWPLALAAYNAGDGPVAGALRRYGASDFFQLSRRGALPGRTRAYVPKVLAAMRIMRDPEAHGFKTPVNLAVYDYEAISVRSPLKLDQVARWIDVPVSCLKDLNPSLRQDRLPPDCGVPLNLPSGARDKFDIAYQGFLRN